MSDFSEHRLYKFLSEPIRLLGLTIDELLLVVVSMATGLLSSLMFWQLTSYLAGGLGLFALKKFKKMGAGKDLRAFLYWHGVWPRPHKSFPAFYQRIWLS
tara:strand:+ start:1205 stop:1504 length:300 start_codon:yes stop_codon:yes gene_type:complete